MCGLDLEARGSEGLTITEPVALREGEVPEAFSRAFDRLIRSIVDEDFEAGSWTSISTSGSWHSIEDTPSWIHEHSFSLGNPAPCPMTCSVARTDVHLRQQPLSFQLESHTLHPS